MDMPTLSLLSVSPIYVAVLGLLWVPLTMRAAFYRIKHGINIGDGGDAELLRRIRGHANFIESVPIALIILIMMEVLGASDTWLHAVGATLVAGRVLHYLAMTELGPFIFRPAGMVATNLVYLVGSVWILVDLFA